MSESDKTIVALWAFDTTDSYPPQFVGAVSDGLREAWYEESERIREEAERWFTDFDDDEPGRWVFEVIYQQVPTPNETRREAAT